MFVFLLLAVLADPAAFVKTLYENDRRGLPDPVYDATSREELQRVFDAPLAARIWRDLVEAAGEVGRMDAHYLYDAQDDEIANLQVKTLENAGGRARVQATFEIGAEKRTIVFHLRQLDGGWRIADIQYAKQSWFDILDAPFSGTCATYAGAVEVPEGFDAKRDATELAELFANERQDYGAAIHFLCAAGRDLKPHEQASMIEHVQKMQRGETKAPLDFCDHVTSGHGMHECALRLQSELEPELRTRYEAIPKTPALETLRKRADEFITADANWETELSRGDTSYPAMAILTRLDGEESFVELLERFSKERAPAATASDYKAAEREMRKLYSDLLDEEWYHLRTAQYTWLSYRNAFASYYLERWRGTASRRALRREIETALMKARTARLKR